MTKEVFIVVDVQNDFCPGGALAVGDGDAVVPVINDLIAGFEHVVLTQDWHPNGHQSFSSTHPGTQPLQTIEAPYGTQILWPDHCVQGTSGADFHRDLNIDCAELVLRKGYNPAIDSYSGFYENDQTTPTGLASYLRERGFSTVHLGGLATDFCVYFTAMDAVKEGFSVVLHEQACRGIDHEGSLEAAMNAMQDAGVEVR